MKECVVLAGGLGTRLQSVVNDVPKCMAQVAGKPFLTYLFNYVAVQHFDHLILSLGYKAEIVIEWLKTQRYPFSVSYVVENYPLGTGGAMKLAFEKVVSDKALVVNGDTFFNINTESFSAFHNLKEADISIALKPMTNFDRYGSVIVDSGSRVVCFNEKEYKDEGLINGGVYLINKNIFSKIELPDKFSFEKDIMESHIEDLLIYGFEQDNYFIDIGIPSDFEKANEDFKR